MNLVLFSRFCWVLGGVGPAACLGMTKEAPRPSSAKKGRRSRSPSPDGGKRKKKGKKKKKRPRSHSPKRTSPQAYATTSRLHRQSTHSYTKKISSPLMARPTSPKFWPEVAPTGSAAAHSPKPKPKPKEKAEQLARKYVVDEDVLASSLASTHLSHKPISASVRVFGRFCPLKGEDAGWAMDAEQQQLEVAGRAREGGGPSTSEASAFRCKLDAIFDEEATQQTVFETAMLEGCQSVISGYNCTFFCYGQTGTGKTYTMFGPDEIDGPEQQGCAPRAFYTLWQRVQQVREAAFEADVTCSSRM